MSSSSRALHPEELFLNDRPARQESPTIGPLRINKRDSSSPASAAGSSPPPNAPLPYPDDRQRPQMRTSSSNERYHDNIRYGSPPAGPGSGSVSPNEYPTALRPRDGREPRVATLAERRGAAPKPLPESPSYDAPDREALAARPYPRPPASLPPGPPEPPANTSQYDYRQQYYPPPQRQSSTSAARPPSSLQPQQGPLNRISSTSTTRAQRGSPPPPETPIVGPGQQPASDIEARYAAAGIAGTGTLQGIQSHNVAAQRRAEQYSGQQPDFPTTAAAAAAAPVDSD